GTKVEVESYEYGIASWYAYKKCLCAAHAYFPKGSILRVTNQANGASVLVKVNDWGPDQRVHPDRVVDLDAEAFKKLAPLSSGTFQAKVEKLKTE
ncbi:MAG: septal ring lytic transglycosylase RlpA family protein, partial [Patescibacteria group bacterium]